jgi:energy-coupling factor transporter ATP-binding protein EcfA2
MQVHQLSFMHHKNAPYFFKDLSFTLAAGKLHALHGKNGMGKSVLLHLLSRKAPPQSIVAGRIIGGENAILVNQRFDQMIADQFSFQDNLKFACMSSFPHPFSRLKNPDFSPDFVEKFHIDPSKPASKLSGGQRQILALLMVLQKERSVLLLDEPTATLDEQNATLVFEFLTTLSLQNVTLLVVCHDRELMNRYVDGQHLYLEMGVNGLRELKVKK